MVVLYHHNICPFSRQIKILLKEKQIDFELIEINFWEKSAELLKFNPSGELPILKNGQYIVAGLQPVTEYIEEIKDNNNFMGSNPFEKAEARRLANWFNEKFYKEVTFHILNERVIKYYKNILDTNSNIIRLAKNNIIYHFDYIDFLLKKNDWLAGDNLSIADFAAASQLSMLDYFGDIPWDYNNNVRDWYSIIKSRPSFGSILVDKIPGFLPQKHYRNLDF